MNTSNREHKYWHSRGYLPHCDTPWPNPSRDVAVGRFSSPEVLHRLREEPGHAQKKSDSLETLLDVGHGACWLKQPDIADILEEAPLHEDGQGYRLLAWCVMPNHVNC